ncbi:MAG TPA: leucine-rich repeat domain-containing protein [Candidatus Limisoma gallistercoris]|nr:leucine-rich repeat domain-containing protein [Candidatus Limisoma gallistercoris]
MNRIFLKPLLAAVLLFSVGTASAATAIGEDWVGDVYYWFYDDGHAVVESDSYSGPDYSGRVVIPATVTYNGTTYNVTEIGDYVFRDCISLTEVVLPEGLKKIGKQQFWGCTALKAIIIPGTVTEIGRDAFNDNTNYFDDPAIETIIFEDSTEPLTGYFIAGDTYFSEPIQLGEKVKTVYLGRNTVTSYGENVESLVISDIVTELKGIFSSKALKEVTIEYSSTPLALGCIGDDKGFFVNFPIESLNLDRQLEYDGSDGITPFAGMEKLTSVVIGDNVTSLGDGLFNGCAGMQSVVIGSRVESIGKDAFLGCTGLQRVDVKNLSAWCGYNFSEEEQNPLYYAKNLYVDGNLVTDLTVPSGVRAVSDYTFCGCDKIVSVTIPSNVLSIGEGAFSECTALKNLTFEDGGELTLGGNNYHRPFGGAPIETLYLGRNVGKQSFADDLASLKKLTVGNNISGFEEKYFEKCNGLREVHVSDLSAWCKINFEDSQSNPLSKAHNMYIDGSLLTSLVIPSGISEIKPYAFYGGECFSSVSLPTGITDIGKYAFYDCSGLASLDLPAGISALDRHAFDGCSELESVTIPSSAKSIYLSAFARCYGISQVTFEDSMEELVVKCYYRIGVDRYNDTDNGDLFENSAIKTMYVGRNITLEKPGYGIAVSNYLGSMTVGGMATSMGKIFYRGSNYDTDSDMPDLSELRIEDSDEPLQVSPGAFSNVSSDRLYVGRNLEMETATPSSPFYDELNFAELGANVTEIMPYMFAGCYVEDVHGIHGLSDVAIDGNIESIGEAAFEGCANLKRFDVQESVVSIGDNAFSDCTALTYFDIPAATVSIGASVFEGCEGLTSIRFESGSELSDIADRTFYGCTGLLSMSLPESVVGIGESAFYGCTGLLSMNLPENVTTVGKSAFYGCSGLAMMSLGESLETVGESAFQDCSALADLHLPQTANSVGNRAFYGCLSLRTVRVDNPVPPAAYANTFSVDTYLNATLSVPSGSQEAYNMAECWYNFRNKEEFPFGSVGTIGDDALNVYFDGSELIVDGVGDDAVVEVYNIAGQRVYSGAVKPVALDRGLYIVRVAGSTFKVAL